MNQCPLKISLIGISQTIPTELNNNKIAMFEILVNDFAIQACNFIVKIVYPYLKPRFKYTKETIQLQESLIFIDGIIEIIDNDLYVYAKEINNVSIPTKNTLNNKKQEIPISLKSTRSKLLSAHQNIKSNSDI
ncbi:5047_t:CDS:1 [Scutellospora calospora]|uniref:5047_t:CDS:1 n=1 Tax=Scutellospora calospora TaxID=85575 RepID=A0ACA9PQ58_9GLOM|nr:5047_t:CDS:1 [Scutellospora calospora]